MEVLYNLRLFQRCPRGKKHDAKGRDDLSKGVMGLRRPGRSPVWTLLLLVEMDPLQSIQSMMLFLQTDLGRSRRRYPPA